MVQISGSQPLLEEQNPAIIAESATTGCSAKVNSVPEVPRLIVVMPGRIFPVPMAAIMLSPPPDATRVSRKYRASPRSPDEPCR